MSRLLDTIYQDYGRVVIGLYLLYMGPPLYLPYFFASGFCRFNFVGMHLFIVPFLQLPRYVYYTSLFRFVHTNITI